MTYVSVNAHTIRANAKHGRAEPPIRIARTKSDSKPTYAHEVELVGKATLLYDPRKPILKCGARLAIQCEGVKVLR